MAIDMDAIKQLAKSQKEPTAEPKGDVVTEKEEAPEAKATEESSLKEETKVEEIVAEEKEESQPTETNQPKAEETKEDVVESAAKPNEVDWQSLAKEAGWKSEDDFEDAKLDWEEDNKSTKESYSDYVSKIIELEKSGHKVDDSAFWKFQSEDFEKTATTAMTNTAVGMDMIADAMQIEDPDAPISELMEDLSYRYKDMLSGDFDAEEPEYKAAMRVYNKDVRKATRDLVKLQKELKLPQNPEIANRLESEEYNKKIESARPKAEKQFKRRVNKFFENNNSYSFEYGGENFEYEFSKKDIADLSENLNSIFENVPKLITPDGLDDSLIKEDAFSQRVESLLWSNKVTRDVLINKAAEQKAAQKLEEDVKSRKNTQAPQANGSKTEKVEKTNIQKLAEQMRKIPSYRRR